MTMSGKRLFRRDESIQSVITTFLQAPMGAFACSWSEILSIARIHRNILQHHRTTFMKALRQPIVKRHPFMRTELLRQFPKLQLLLTAAAAVHLLCAPLHAQQPADPFPTSYADPAVPLLQLPTNFRARRTSANLAMAPGKPVEIFNATGAGCVRHLWFVFGEKNIDDLDHGRWRC